MGKYGDLLNKIDTSEFIKIEPGRQYRFRLLSDPWISQQQFVDKGTGESRIATRFSWPVYDYSQQRIRVLTQGKSVFEQIAGACEAWPQGDTMPSPFDVVIKRTGTGQFDTQYTVQAVPYGGDMPSIRSAELPNMAEKSKGIPVMQVLEGKSAPVIPATVPGVTPAAPANPTHRDAETLDEREPAGEQVLTDIPDGDVDMDSIPDDEPDPDEERPEFLK